MIASSEHSQSNTMFEPLLHHEKVKNSQTTLSQANFFSRFTFSWINPVLSLGHSKALSLENIPPLESQDKADTSYQKFAKAWDSLLPKGSSNKNLVIRAILKVFLKENISTVISAFARSTSAALSPLLIYAFVKYNNSERNLYEGLGLFGLLFLSRMVESLCQRHWFFSSRRSGMRMRSALMVAAYEKLLNLSSLGRSRHSSGEIVNYIAVDAYRMGESLWWFHSGWSFALQLVVLFCVVGLGALPGLVLLLISALLNVPFAMKLKKCQSEVLVSQDQRLRATSEILNNIKIIKLQSWEDKFKGSVESLRDEEFKWVSETQFTKAYGSVLYFISPTIICAVIFLGCALFESATLNAATIFTVFATMRSMGEPVRFIPEALSVMVQTKISLDRLNAFLLEDETKSDDEKTRKSSLPYSDNSVEIKAADFRWDQESLTPSLRCINLAIKRGQKIAVCGPVGAGKSSVLHAILGEMPNTSGTVKVHGTIAYVSQTSWIQSGTIRDNILFGKSLEEAQYENAIKACALDKDISGFKHGDLTEIGQRGINLSGGQKQRIQLARAVYDDADIYLLDDPFSAVDAHTSSVLFHECVMTALREKTVILVTHQVEFLSEVDSIMVIEGGCIAEAGSYEELMASGTTFEQLIAAHKDAMTGLSDLHQNQEELREVDIINTQERHYEGEVGEAIQLTQEEQREMGSAVWKMFLDYVVISKGLLLLCLSLISLVGVAVFLAASSYWLAIATQSPKITKVMMVGVYTGLSIPSAVFVYLRSLFVAHLGLKASKAFFSGFNSAIFNAPMSFFDSTPVGRIITRASSDLSTLDFDIPFATVNAPHTAVELLVGIVIMAYATWEVLIVAAAAAVAAIYIMGYYQVSARELVRINGITKAPVVSCTAETLAGVVTIRAFKMVDRFFLSFLHLVDIDATLFLHTNAAMEWLLLRMEMLQNLILFTEALLILFLPKGYVTSAERIKQFMLISQEPPKVVEDKRPSPSWPSKGRIELQDLKVKYRPNSPPVLKGITCTFREGARIGIVGRTGSGKSTLISSLFRLVEPASGKILIDEINICSIGLKDLRMRLSIIPQEPTLFRGSVRTNLDPLGQFSDDEIWKTLEKCQLKEAISSLPNLLDSSVNDEGDNWSVGQRQLFCLGRVLLRRNRILVLDEATASIDSATDAILQRVIREEFSECTIITVAHRVPTVLDSDMVMVLSYGKIVEYDEPSKLLEANSSSFSKLVAEYWSSSRKNP